MTQKERLIELLQNIPMANVVFGRKSVGRKVAIASHIADYLLENGVIVLPCKVGDTVWFLNTYNSIAMRRNAVYKAKVVRVFVEKGNVLCLPVQVENEFGTTEYPRITEIGKTVFLTREEAEKALAGMKNDG